LGEPDEEDGHVRKLIVTEFVSLDGVMDSPGGEPGYAHAGWVGPLFSDELGAYKLEEQQAADEHGGPIMIAGSRSVVHALLAAGLVDQINLQVFPLMLGSGIRVYPERDEPTRLELVSSRAVENGVVLQTYRVL
jgi:dihydrofolate reductase